MDQQKLVKRVVLPPRNPDYICRNCGWRCWIGEEGYAFGHDTHEVKCQNCANLVAEHDTTGYVTESWKPPAKT